MVTQNVSSKKVTPLMGILTIAIIAALLFAASFIGSFVSVRAGTVWGQIILVAVAACAAFYVMRYMIIEFQYTVSDDIFYIERIYGRRNKVLAQIPLSDVLYLGAREKALEKWPSARNMITATANGVECEKVCVAYRANGQVCLAIIQPNEEMKRALFDVEKRARLAKDKWGD